MVCKYIAEILGEKLQTNNIKISEFTRFLECFSNRSIHSGKTSNVSEKHHAYTYSLYFAEM